MLKESMLSANHIAGFLDQQYLKKEKIDVAIDIVI